MMFLFNQSLYDIKIKRKASIVKKYKKQYRKKSSKPASMAVIISHYGKIVTAFLCMKKTERGESPIHKAPSQPMDKIQTGGILMYYVSYTKDGKDKLAL